ncbi:MAG: cell division protein ZapA [Firmicutes bacterium]|nr:cell division protein ZapA [Bacillota bacterium]
MNREINRVRIRLFGKDYTVKTDQSVTKTVNMATELDNKLEAFKDRFPNLTKTDVALLTALSLLAEMDKLREEKRELWELLGEATSKTE